MKSIVLAFLPLTLFALASAEERISYAREILPILSENCFYCHGPDKEHQKADLRLDVRADAINSFAWDPDNPPESEALIRIFSDDKDEMMPPPESHRILSRQQKDLIKKWVEQGAEYETHWAFVSPPKEIPVPPTIDQSWSKNPIDSFILARLEKEKILPSPPASLERWLRRVTFDLTGLPPTQAELDAFISKPNDRDAVVDRLLASSRFGERMASPWLDVARYADSSGYQADVDLHAWPYRDWVIRAFNENLPLDDFIIHQLAGDLLPDATREMKLATAFNRVHRKTNEGGSVPEEFRQEGISDRVHTIGTAFMALTMECARCHDHKYDPISAKDYYAMGAFFNSIDEHGMLQGGNVRGNIATQPALLLPTSNQEKQLADLDKAVAATESSLASYVASSENSFRRWLVKASEFPSSDLAVRIDFEEKSLKNTARKNADAKLGGNRLAPGKHGNSLFANGDSVTSLPTLGIDRAEQPFSFSLWLKPAERQARAIVFANVTESGVNHSGYSLVLGDGRLQWTLAREFPGCAASISSRETIPVGEWTHVTVTNDGSRKASGLKIFLNGVPAETEIIADSLTHHMPTGDRIGIAARGSDSGLRGGMIDDFQVHLRAITAAEVASIFSGKSLTVTSDSALLRDYYLSAIDPTARKLANEVTAARNARLEVLKKVREIPTMRESARPVPAFILARGDYTQPTVKVQRETPDWLPPFSEDQPRDRLGFAKWLTSPDHPLTARVMINRVWQEIFGIGIVETSDNFGLQGAQPSHPELLDWLARDLMEHGWDHKRAIKQLVLSATYAQDSKVTPELRERDPANTLLARGPARRLTAEMLRDSALALSGLLAETIGGPPAKPYQPAGSMWKDTNNFLPEYVPDKGEGLHRRSLYTFWRRTTTPPNMILFDSATREFCSTRRTATNTPLQALVLLNDPQFVEAARKLAERIMKEGGSTDESRVKWTYRIVTGKPPTNEQLPILLELITQQRAIFASKSSDVATLLRIGDSLADSSLDPTELATFTALSQALLNSDAYITLR